MHAKNLQLLGMSEQQAVVYLALLELGPSNVGKLVQHIGIPRISCYDTLNRLIAHGFVSFVKTKRHRLYQATDPNRLRQRAEEQEQHAHRQCTTIHEMLPALLSIKKSSEIDESEANIYKTKEGMKSLFELMLVTQKPILVASATGKALQEMDAYFSHWQRKRQKLHIPLKIVFNIELRENVLTNVPHAAIRFLPAAYSSPSTLFIFGDYVATMLWSRIPFAFLIHSKEIADTYRNYFKLIWSIARP